MDYFRDDLYQIEQIFLLSTDSKMKRKSSIKPPLTALKNVFVQGFGSAGCPERNNHFL